MRHRSTAHFVALLVAITGIHCGGDSPYDQDPNLGGGGNAGGDPTVEAGAGGGGVPTAGSGGIPTAGSGGTAGVGGGTGGGSSNTAPGFVNLAPELGAPLDPNGGTTLTPPPPDNWIWYPIDGAQCRDGSQAGFFARFTDSDKLYMYIEGGGACSSPGFCNYNPPNVDSAISGDGETVLGSTFGVFPIRQQPGAFEGGVLNGVFDNTKDENPLKNWNGIYIPYCTGDVHFGSRTDVTVPGVAQPQQFVGGLNMRKFVSRIVPTFKDKVSRVLLTGVSAGSFGAALNFSMIQDAFGDIPVDGIMDSGIPFSDQHMPVCMQKRWRALWGLNDSLPADCDECFNEDGGGLLNYADFLIRKHPNAKLAMITSMEDEVIRLFFSSGLNDCADFETADPVIITTFGQFLGQIVSTSDYAAALQEVRARFKDTGRLATYFMGGAISHTHQHVFRTRFYDQAAGSKTIAAFMRDFLAGEVEHIGP